MSTLKRACDVAGGLAGVAVFAPIMALVTVAILVDDGPPVLFRQPRVGYRRHPFTVLKFRSMRDGRVTRAGRLLRATGLDEIAQFFNILKGEMSAVGPRPLTEADVMRFGWTDPACDFRWEARPGLTGLAQLAGARSPAGALELDRAYLARWSPVDDAVMIALSFVVNVLGKSRVQRHFGASAFVAKRLANATGTREK